MPAHGPTFVHIGLTNVQISALQERPIHKVTNVKLVVDVCSNGAEQHAQGGTTLLQCPALQQRQWNLACKL